jgi:hypothetical protein
VNPDDIAKRERRHRESRERAERRRREKEGWVTAPVQYNAQSLPYWLASCELIHIDEVDDPKCVAGAITEIIATLQAEGLFFTHNMKARRNDAEPYRRSYPTYKVKAPYWKVDRKLGWAFREPRKKN